jgi:NADH dehydrogenase FAD-containing subunit
LLQKQHEFNDEEKMDDFLSKITIYDPSLFTSHAALESSLEKTEEEDQLTSPKSKYDDEQLLHDLSLRVFVPYTGIQLRDIRIGFKTHHKAFRGKDIVTWIAADMHIDREEATTVARLLQRRKHVFARVDKKKQMSNSFYAGELGDDDRVYTFSGLKKLVIIGAGYAGTAAARILEDYADVTVIDIKPHMAIHSQGINLIAEPSSLSTLKLDHHKCLLKAKIILGRATDIDPTNRKVTVETANGEEIVGYHALIIATGLHGHVPFPVTKPQAIIDSYSIDSVVQGHNALKVARKIAVIGSGHHGVEFACETAALYTDANVFVISRDKAVLIGGDSENALSETIRRAMLKFKNLSMIHGIVQQVEGKSITYQPMTSQSSITADFDVIILASGQKPNSELMMKSMSHVLDDHDRIRVNSRMQVFKHDVEGDTLTSETQDTSTGSEESPNRFYRNIFAVGGVSSLVDTYKNPFFSVHHALRACHVVRAIELSGDIKEIPEWKQKKEPLNITVGPKKAMAVMDDKVVMYNKISRKARRSTTARVTQMLSGPSKQSIRLVFEVNKKVHGNK